MSNTPPLASKSNVARVSRKSTGVIILEVIIIILLLIHFGFFVNIFGDVERIQNKECPLQQSDLCSDFNPCTIDYLETTCGNRSDSGGINCKTYQCLNVPLANGSCCNRDDFCYTDDPAKACVFGQCKSPNASKCKGYCGNATEFDEGVCLDLPLTVDSNINTGCFFGSCVTITVIVDPVSDPFSLLDINNNNFNNLNTASCLQAFCTSNINAGFTACYYTWTCAPFINASNAEQKKRIESIEQKQQQLVDDNTTFYFPIPNAYGSFYDEINHKLNEVTWELYTAMSNPVKRK